MAARAVDSRSRHYDPVALRYRALATDRLSGATRFAVTGTAAICCEDGSAAISRGDISRAAMSRDDRNCADISRPAIGRAPGRAAGHPPAGRPRA